MGQVEDILAASVNEFGWHVMPDGRWIRLGDYVTLGDGVKLGNDVKLGNGVTLGNDVTLGNGVTLGNYVTLGNGVKLGTSPTYIIGERYFFAQTDATGQLLQSGCITKPLAWWVENVRRTAEHEYYSPEQIDQYEAYVGLFARLAEIKAKHAKERT